MFANIRLTNRQLVVALIVSVGFLTTFLIITHLSLSLYEVEERYDRLRNQFDLVHSHFNRFNNMSFPIAYSLDLFERYHDMPTIYVITPTNNRRVVQIADLTRMLNTLWLVPKIVWILVEDSPNKTKKIAKFLEKSRIPYVHLNTATPEDYVVKANDKAWSKPRGVLQRNKGIAWLRDHQDELHERGVVYFADDDNTYDVRLFEEMRYTTKVSVWPVAFVGEILYERPICKNGKVVSWFSAWGAHRPFPLDMAGFAVNLQHLLAHPSASFSLFAKRGMQESHFLSHLTRVDELDCKADDCKKIYVWHTNTKSVLLRGEQELQNKNMSYEEDFLDQF